jgi:hypothetical protein
MSEALSRFDPRLLGALLSENTGAFWTVSACFAMRFLGAGFRLLKTRSMGGIATWIAIFTLVVLQMTTTLRPILGTAPTLLSEEKKFFLAHWMDSFK